MFEEGVVEDGIHCRSERGVNGAIVVSMIIPVSDGKRDDFRSAEAQLRTQGRETVYDPGRARLDLEVAELGVAGKVDLRDE